MDLFLARQPIFNRELSVCGYELLHRACQPAGEGAEEKFAAMQAMIDTLMVFGPDQVLAGKRGHIPLSRDMVLSDLVWDLPPDSFVFEVPKPADCDESLMEACLDLRRRGYALALQDVDTNREPSRLTGQAEFLRVDFHSTTSAVRRRLVREHARPGVRMLAEKVESQHEFADAKAEGFTFFQGNFFAEPALETKKPIRPLKLNLLRLLSEVHQPDLELRHIETILKHDTALCYNLLRHVNSAAFGCRVPINSVLLALTMLGENEVKRWASVAALPGLALDKPEELVATAIMRARFCELMAPAAGFRIRVSELFLMGMFSLLDAMVDRPMEELLGELRLAPDVRDALLGRLPPQNGLMQIGNLIRACERADWDQVSLSARGLGIPLESISNMYLQAIAWSFQLGDHPPARPSRLIH